LDGTCGTHRRRKLYLVFVRKSEDNRPLRRPRDRWDDDIKMEVKYMVYDGVDSTHVAQDSGYYEDGNELLVSVKGREFLD